MKLWYATVGSSMCVFSREVEEVCGTRIFARAMSGGGQVLVYSMAVSAADDLAMILPLPVPPRSHEDSIRFINLEDYPRFFDDLERGFPQLSSLGSDSLVDQILGASGTLQVHDVGQFQASFVPSIADFGRLDPRFRLPEATWEHLPLYKDWGFAVFKLKLQESSDKRDVLQYFEEPTRGELAKMLRAAELLNERRPKRYPPMAFEFPRRDTALLFFPTMHIHDGQVYPQAHFDHQLYCQADPDLVDSVSLASSRWEQSFDEAGGFMDARRSQGVVSASEPVYRLVLGGTLPNADVTLRGRGQGSGL